MNAASAWKLKAIGACLLVVCFVLPIKSCTEYRHADGTLATAEPGESLPPDARKVTTRYYLVQEFRADQPVTWAQIVAFVLPLAAVAAARFGSPSRLKKVLWFLEPLLMAAVVASLELALVFYRADIGAYVARTAVGIYSVGWLIEAYSRWRARRLRLATSPQS